MPTEDGRIPLCGPVGSFRVPGRGRLYVCQGCGEEVTMNTLPHKPIVSPLGWFIVAGGGGHGIMYCNLCGVYQKKSKGTT